MVRPSFGILFVLSCFAAAEAFGGAELRHGLVADAPAADTIVGWERQSYPLGCGHFGWNVFGGVTNERVQVTHNAVLTADNLTNALELRLRTDHRDATGYRRWLDVDASLAAVAGR